MNTFIILSCLLAVSLAMGVPPSPPEAAAASSMGVPPSPLEAAAASSIGVPPSPLEAAAASSMGVPPSPLEAAAASRPRHDLPALQQEDIRDEFGQYAFRYVTAEGTVVSERGSLVPSDSGEEYILVVEGESSYIGTDGKTYTSKYSAGPDGNKVDLSSA